MEGRSQFMEDEVDLRALGLSLWSRRWLVLGATAAAALVAAAASLTLVPPVYESRTYIQVSKHSAAAYATAQGAARVLTSMSLLRPIAARHGIRDERKLERMVKAEAVRDTQMVYVRIRDSDPDRLRAFTSDVIREFLRLASERVLERRRLAQERYRAVAEQLRALGRVAENLVDASGSDGSRAAVAAGFQLAHSELLKAQREIAEELASTELPYLVQEPYIPQRPVSPRPGLNAAVAATLGFLAAVFGVLVRDAWAAAPEQGGVARAVPEPHGL